MVRRARNSKLGIHRVETVSVASPEETEALGVRLADIVPVPGLVLLRGALGTGKTTLTRGLARGMGVSDSASVRSPSFTLVNNYQGKFPIYHVDLYRLEGARDLYSIGLEDFLCADGVTIVEWGERLGPVPSEAIEVRIEDTGGDTRRISVQVTCPPESSLKRKEAVRSSKKSARSRHAGRPRS